MSGAWTTFVLAGTAAVLHGRPLGPEVVRRVDVMQLERPALVLGSTQPEADADRRAIEAFGVELARRRSGGGAVFLVPNLTVWVDVEVPRLDDLWDDDVGRAFHWLGRAWASAVGELGVAGEVHTGGVLESRWSRQVCFGGLGSGEVTVGGRKLVGISQRRTRAGARFQCVVHRRWDPVPILGLLALDDADRVAAMTDLAAAGEGLDVDEGVLVEALVRQLPG